MSIPRKLYVNDIEVRPDEYATKSYVDAKVQEIPEVSIKETTYEKLWSGNTSIQVHEYTFDGTAFGQTRLVFPVGQYTGNDVGYIQFDGDGQHDANYIEKLANNNISVEIILDDEEFLLLGLNVLKVCVGFSANSARCGYYKAMF